MPLHVIILGAPGAGKGTQAERLAERERLPRISTGDVLREAITRRSALGKVAAASIDDGHFVGDETMIGLVGGRLAQADCENGFVLDGFPRTVPQGQAFDAWMSRCSGDLAVVHLEVPEAELVRRLTTRRVCVDCGRNMDPAQGPAEACRRCGGAPGRRADDDEAVIRERMLVYARETAPLVDRYRRLPGFAAVDGNQPPGRVNEAILAAIGRGPLVGAR